MIEVKEITKTYRMGSVEVQALRGVSFKIERGEAVAIMGASGSGKSTLMNILGCLDLPTSGQYILDGQNIAEMNDDELAAIRNHKIGFVFQQFNLLPRITVQRNVEMPILYAGMTPEGKNGAKAEAKDEAKAGNGNGNMHKRSEAALKAVGLGDRMNHRPMELSGGQQQRVAVARALINEPDLILADEPTGNLDSHTGEEIMKLLLGLNQSRNLTLLIVTHDPSIAAQTQRVIHLHDGLIQNDGVGVFQNALAQGD